MDHWESVYEALLLATGPAKRKREEEAGVGTSLLLELLVAEQKEAQRKYHQTSNAEEKERFKKQVMDATTKIAQERAVIAASPVVKKRVTEEAKATAELKAKAKEAATSLVASASSAGAGASARNSSLNDNSKTPMNPLAYPNANQPYPHDWETWNPYTSPPLTFYDYQLAVVRVNEQPHIRAFGVYHPPGSGKTITTFLYCEVMLWIAWNTHKLEKRVVFVSAPSLHDNLKKTLVKGGRSPTHIRRYYHTCSGSDSGMWTIEYAMGHPEEFQRACEGQIVVFDESQRLNTVITRPSKDPMKRATQKLSTFKFFGDYVVGGKQVAAFILGWNKRWKGLMLSATQLKNGPNDLYNISIMFADEPQEFMQTIKRKDAMIRAENFYYLDQIWRCRCSFLTVRDGKIAERMPTTTEINVLIQMTPESYKTYRGVETKTLLSWKTKQKKKSGEQEDEEPVSVDEKIHVSEAMSEIINRPGQYFPELRQAANEPGVDTDSQKRLFIVEQIVKALKEKKKMVVSSNFKDNGVHLLDDELKRLKVRYDEITGDVKASHRQPIINKFNEDKLDLLKLTAAGSTGIDLFGSEISILFELGWHEAGRRQAHGRSARLGSGAPAADGRPRDKVLLYNLILCKPWEYESMKQRMNKLIGEKAYGAGQQLLLLPASTVAAREAGDVMPSIDVYMFNKQISKASKNYPYMFDVVRERWSIERNKCIAGIPNYPNGGTYDIRIAGDVAVTSPAPAGAGAGAGGGGLAEKKTYFSATTETSLRMAALLAVSGSGAGAGSTPSTVILVDDEDEGTTATRPPPPPRATVVKEPERDEMDEWVDIISGTSEPPPPPAILKPLPSSSPRPLPPSASSSGSSGSAAAAAAAKALARRKHMDAQFQRLDDRSKARIKLGGTMEKVLEQKSQGWLASWTSDEGRRVRQLNDLMNWTEFMNSDLGKALRTANAVLYSQHIQQKTPLKYKELTFR